MKSGLTVGSGGRRGDAELERDVAHALKHELKERIMLGIKDVNRYPVIHTWSYKLAEAA
jgi:hypothetical protein